MKRIIYLILFVFLFSFQISAQGKYGHVTPQTADFMKYGNTPVSLYTGQIDLSIPIYHIKDPDFDIPVSLTYNSEGFQPQKHSGFVGHDWFLNAGGCITREVNNQPDEQIKSQGMMLCNGFLVQSRLSTLDKDDVFNFSIGSEDTNGGFKFNNPLFGNDYDYMPDVFSFHFLGHSGKFIIGNDGLPKLISNEYFKVDMSGVMGQQPKYGVNPQPNENSQIKLTDINGYNYYFGGNIHSLEYNINVLAGTSGQNSNNSGYIQLTPTIDAWHLTKIVAPNGRTVEFNYTKYANNYSHYHKNDPLWMFKKYYYNEFSNATSSALSGDARNIVDIYLSASMTFADAEKAQNMADQTNDVTIKAQYLNQAMVLNQQAQSLLEQANSEFISSGVTSSSLAIRQALENTSSTQIKQSATKSAIISDIVISDINFKLTFNKSIEDKPLFYTGDDFCNKNYQLNSVEAKIDNELLSLTEFTYEYKGDSEQWGRRFLKELTNFDQSKYKFTYNDIYTYPDADNMLQIDMDDYGFWKNNQLLGLIKSVTYPTGGKTIYTFERNNYGKRRYYDYFSYDYDSVLNKPKLALLHNIADLVPTLSGGARIRKIENYSSNILKSSTLFNYTNQFDYEGEVIPVTENGIPESQEGSDIMCFDYEDQTNMLTSNCENLLPRTSNNTYTTTTSQSLSTGILHSDWILVHMQNNYVRFIKDKRTTNYNVNEPHIGYSKVTEIIKDELSGEKQYKVNEFSDYVFNMDVDDKNFFNTGAADFGVVFRYQHAFNSMSAKRGKLCVQKLYSNNKELINEKNYQFQNISSHNMLIFNYEDREASSKATDDYIVTLFNFNNFAVAKKIYLFPTNLLSSMNIDYFDGLRFDNSVQMNYDKLNRVVEEKILSSDGRYAFTEYRYPDNIVSAATSSTNVNVNAYQKMVSKHMLGTPVETTTGILNQGQKKYTEASLLLYGLNKKLLTLDDGTLVERLSNSPFPVKQMVFTPVAPVDNYSFANISNNEIVWDNRLRTKAEFEFSDLLRLTKISPVGELPTTYIWDTKNLYPTHEIQGPMITNYIYKPMIGISSKTDTRGITTYYSYDDFNRLKETYIIENGAKKVLQKYDYHFANQ